LGSRYIGVYPIKQLKAENEQKDEKINYFEKKIDELSKVYCNRFVVVYSFKISRKSFFKGFC